MTSCVDGQVIDSCTPGAPAADDATCDGVDDDCDGVTDEDYAPIVTWNGSATFRVFVHGREVDTFTVYGITSIWEAHRAAAEWIEGPCEGGEDA